LRDECFCCLDDSTVLSDTYEDEDWSIYRSDMPAPVGENDSAMTTEEEEMDLTVMTTEEEDDEEGPDSDDDRRGRRGRDGPLANHDWSEQADRVIMTGSDGSMMIMISGATKLAAASAATMATMTLW